MDMIKRLNIFSKRAIVYTFLIFFISIVSGYIYYALSQKIYQNYASIKINSKDIETQKDILQSRKILEKVIKDLNFETEYYTKALFYKKVNLYANKPFIIKNIRVKKDIAYEKEFGIKFLKNGEFMLLKDSIPIGSHKKEFVSKSLFIDTPFLSFELKPIKIDPNKKYFIVFHKLSNLLKDVKKRLKITQASKNSSVIKIYYSDYDPKKVKDFLLKLIEIYKEETKNSLIQKDSKIYAFLQKEIEKAKQNTSKSLQDLQRYQKQNHISLESLSIPSSLSIGYEEELRKIDLELNTLNMIKKESQKENYMIATALEGKYPELASLAKEIDQKSKELEKIKEKNGELAPETILLSQKIDKLKNTFNKLIKDMIRSLYKRKKTLLKILNKNSVNLSKLPKKEQELIALKQKYSVNKNYYDYLLKEKSKLLLQKLKENDEITVIDPPVISKSPYAPNLKKILIYSLVAGLFLSLFSAFFKNKEESVVRKVTDIENISSLPLYGAIPFVTDHRLYNKIYVTKEDIPSLYKEAYREIKTNIELLDSGWKSKVIGISSTIPGEGKTVFVSNLAAILASGEQKTILLCADFLLSEIHQKFNLSNEIGLSDLLEGRANIQEVLQTPKDIKNLTIITSGSSINNPHKLISSKEMKLLIKNLRKYFDFIIVDTTPIDVTNDSFILLKECDISIFVLKSEFSQKTFLKRIEQLCKNFGIKNPGFVMTSVKKENLNRVSYDQEYIFRKTK